MAARQDLERNLQSVRQALADRMIYSDRVCFAAATTLAADTGLHPCTVRRALTRLQTNGVIERVHDFTVKGRKVRSNVWRFCVGVLRKPKCATTETSFPKTSRTYNTYGVGADRLRRVCEKSKRRREGVGEVVPIALPLFENDTPAQRNTAPGQALYAAIMDGLPVALPRSVITVAVKHGSAALYDGVDPAVVLAGCLAAIRQGKQRYTSEIIADIALAVAGERMNTHQYRRELDNVQAASNPVLQRISEIMGQIQTDKETGKR